MSFIFVETASKAISDYRKMLRRHLTQSDRMAKLAELGLKKLDYTNQIALYHAGQKIVRDIETHLDVHEKNYYTYSGAGTFAKYLKEFLSNYMVEGAQVIHRAQKASRALLESIQLIALPAGHMTPDVLESINHSSVTIAHYGSEEQCELYKENLGRYYRERGSFFGPLLNYFEEQLRVARQVNQAA